ncbi:hypothetical protein AKJ51_03120 [candidate division MSBL1 archaeon SCGC-AAA382A20]|uniref:Uncharacterized protein n=1 Tax=candidate division MSBL1 archaeon SCGC-AAA382A20 TaxID=1698280 RepID=A0A133VJU9_9EURY|nr:hypothetical protein AKJ51_03120 [candidate division MSBL1 archaeon SCGC-AAA382A20]
MKSLNVDNLDFFPKNPSELREMLLDLPYCVDVKLPTQFGEHILPKLQNTRLGLLKGAEKEYRDYNEKDSLHVRVYNGYLKAYIDRKNPIYKPFSHFLEDFFVQNLEFFIVFLMFINFLFVMEIL